MITHTMRDIMSISYSCSVRRVGNIFIEASVQATSEKYSLATKDGIPEFVNITGNTTY